MNDLDHIRHSLAHVLAAAVLKKFPEAKLGIGPTIEHGFYYDFLLSRTLTPEDLKAFETEMRQLVKQHLSFSGKSVTLAVAKKQFKHQPFKLELIEEFSKDGQELTVYNTGDIFFDLCRGGHVKNTREIPADAFRLDKLAGAYWRGSEKNPMLQRIYGLAFLSKAELDAYLKQREEAEKRDHRKLGRELKLFTFDDLVGSGLPIWLPNGTIIREEIEQFAKDMEYHAGYQRISTPHVAKEALFQTSGHLPYYADSMFPAMKLDDGNYYLKAMNCPITHLVYRSEPRSYRDLPLRLAEYGTVYRNELSGTLAGLLRVRSLAMNDAHIYCRADQVEAEFTNVMKLVLEYFKVFGLTDYAFQLSRWDPDNKEKFFNEPKNWDMAEEALRRVLKHLKVKFSEAVGEAAFYGPKVDVQYRAVSGREETMSTIQLDFSAKERFGLTYHDKDGKENREVFVIHRAPLSTHERFLAFLIEHYAGAFPLWLSPVQVEIIPVADRHVPACRKLARLLINAGVRVRVAESSDTVGYKIRRAEKEKIPYMIVFGDKEKSSGKLPVRVRGTEKLRRLSPEKLQNLLKKEIEKKH